MFGFFSSKPEEKKEEIPPHKEYDNSVASEFIYLLGHNPNHETAKQVAKELDIRYHTDNYGETQIEFILKFIPGFISFPIAFETFTSLKDSPKKKKLIDALFDKYRARINEAKNHPNSFLMREVRNEILNRIVPALCRYHHSVYAMELLEFINPKQVSCSETMTAPNAMEEIETKSVPVSSEEMDKLEIKSD